MELNDINVIPTYKALNCIWIWFVFQGKVHFSFLIGMCSNKFEIFVIFKYERKNAPQIKSVCLVEKGSLLSFEEENVWNDKVGEHVLTEFGIKVMISM